MSFLDELRAYLEHPRWDDPGQPSSNATNSDDDDLRIVHRYASAIRAITRVGSNWARTSTGMLILQLPDRDAIRWMLAVEVTQSIGIRDEWRLSRSAAATLLKNEEGWGGWFENTLVWPAAENIMRRLDKMGLLDIEDNPEGEWTAYCLLPEGRALFEEIASNESTPFTVLAEALLQDETSVVIDQFSSAATRIQNEGAAAATTRHARMVAHEIRNALVPVQVTLEMLYGELERSGDRSVLAKHRDAIDAGVDRIFKFVKEMVSVAAHGAEPAEPFSIVPAIEDAIAVITAEFGAQITFACPPDLAGIKGNRGRFTLAVANLLRNAVQARADGSIEVCIEERLTGGIRDLVVTVDDSGPGVPPSYRELIFRRGFSQRSGGTGEGLALVREVVESEMRGRASCEESPLRGARFVLRLPLNGKGTGR